VNVLARKRIAWNPVYRPPSCRTGGVVGSGRLRTTETGTTLPVQHGAPTDETRWKLWTCCTALSPCFCSLAGAFSGSYTSSPYSTGKFPIILLLVKPACRCVPGTSFGKAAESQSKAFPKRFLGHHISWLSD